MFLNKDMVKGGWLAAIRPMALILLLIGECTAQEMYTDLIGMKRRHVQVVLKKESFVDYQKTHVTYQLTEHVKQTVLYNSDTCKAYYWSVASNAIPEFEEKLKTAGFTSADYKRTAASGANEPLTLFLVERVVANVAQANRQKNQRNSVASSPSYRAKNVSNSGEFRASELPPKELVEKTNWDSVNTMSVLGWPVSE
jgi:hypothetical protein